MKAPVGTAFAVFIALFAAGCSSAGSKVKPEASLSHEERCVRMAQDLHLYCRDGLRNGKVARGKECLSRKLELRKACN